VRRLAIFLQGSPKKRLFCNLLPLYHTPSNWLEAADVGWRFGDEIVAVNGKAVASREDGDAKLEQ
jgi:hypothetical protein